jgi:hypothetical protein
MAALILYLPILPYHVLTCFMAALVVSSRIVSPARPSGECWFRCTIAVNIWAPTMA